MLLYIHFCNWVLFPYCVRGVYLLYVRVLYLICAFQFLHIFFQSAAYLSFHFLNSVFQRVLLDEVQLINFFLYLYFYCICRIFGQVKIKKTLLNFLLEVLQLLVLHLGLLSTFQLMFVYSACELRWFFHVDIQFSTVQEKVKVGQSCPTLCDPMDLVHGILPARILE